jgi:predicted RNase H-like HicB family nuclease
MKHEYPFQVMWSPEDEAYIAITMQLPGCMADGATVDEAIQNLRVIVEEWIETARREGREVPEPWTVIEVSQQFAHEQQALQKQIESAVTNAVEKMISTVSEKSNPYPFRGGFFHPMGFEPEHSGRR